MPTATQGIVSLGDCRLDLGAALLLRHGQPVHLRAKSFALLLYLASHPGRVIAKAELLDAVWPDVTVTEDSLTQTVRDLRQALGDHGQTRLRTVSRRGYMLVADAAPDLAARPAAPLPTIAVLPFRFHPADSADGPVIDGPVIDGIVEEITHGLARYGQVQVIAHHSAFQFRPDAAVSPADAARQLGATYFVTGAAQRQTADIRLSVTLGEATSGQQLWGESFDLLPGQMAKVQAAIPHRIVVRLTLDQERRIARIPAASATENLTAYQHFVAGVALLRRYGTGVNEAGRDHLLQALALDPQFALAHAYLGLAEMIIGGYGSASSETLERGLDHARTGLQLAPEEARCHRIVSLGLEWQRNHAAAELHARRALQLNPSDADMLAGIGTLRTLRGHPEEGLSWLERAEAVNPLHPDWYHYAFAVTLQACGHHAEAIARINCMPRLNAWSETRLAACHAMLGEDGEAARHLDIAEKLSPGWDALREAATSMYFEHQGDTDRLLHEVGRAVAAQAARTRTAG